MTNRTKLWNDERGATAVETAFVLPVILVFIYGIFMMGVMFHAKAGLQNGLGEGARYATIYPVPTDAQIRAKISAKVFRLGIGTFGAPTVTSGSGYKDLAVSFTMTPNFIFYTPPPITLNQSKRVYIAG